ncbi:MAG TPA: asparagine synthase (glutamine-hydrolyzing) [Aggregatilineaceae bacterium]|nr:asparagine synthase (glutamine-hydrolyzing) [Aggregatilineaceae bacterium]
MCGIYGHYSRCGTGDRLLVEQMANVLAHRGPDGYGTYHKGPLAFGAGRLAIIDLNAGVQPIFSEDRRIAVVYNGEIYNYRDLRAELERNGHHFATQTDTEVIVHGYEQWGDAVIERLRGMFALCIWDEPRERLLLARDRTGEKPLYYTWIGDEFLFASELKALLVHPKLTRAVNRTAFLSYLTLGYVAPPHTMFEGVNKLPPAHKLIVDRSTAHSERYWTLTVDTYQAAASYQDTVCQVRDLLEQSVEMRLMSDVPLGVFLSGGCDSSAVAALVARASGKTVQSFTVGFDMEPGSKGDSKFNVDMHYAREVSDFLHTEHHEIRVRGDEILSGLFPHLIYALDEPVAQHAIVQTVHVSALARLTGVPVLLGGDGGDELFAGYPHYRTDRILERYLRIPALLRRGFLTPLLERLPSTRFDAARKLAQKSRDTNPTQRYLHWMRTIDPMLVPHLLGDPALAEQSFDTVNDIVSPLLRQPHTPHFADRIAYTSLNLWLAEDSNMRVDKMSMAMSIEARSPFQDHRLAELAFSIPLNYKLRNGDFKTVLKEAIRDLVPSSVLTRPKWGFMPPGSNWLRTGLRPLVDQYLSPDYVAAVGLFQPETVSRLVESHMNGGYELWPIWSMLTFHLWHALYLDRSLTLEHKLSPDDLRPMVVN